MKFANGSSPRQVKRAFDLSSLELTAKPGLSNLDTSAMLAYWCRMVSGLLTLDKVRVIEFRASPEQVAQEN